MHVQIFQYFAHVFQTGWIRAAASDLAHEGLSLGILQPGLHFREDLSGSHAGGVGTGKVFVEVLMEVEDEVGSGTVGVRDVGKSGGRATRYESVSASVAVAGKEVHLRGGACAANSGDGVLDAAHPCREKVCFFHYVRRAGLVPVSKAGGGSLVQS